MKKPKKKSSAKIPGQGGTSSPYPRQARVPMGPGADVPGKMPHPVQLPERPGMFKKPAKDYSKNKRGK